MMSSVTWRIIGIVFGLLGVGCIYLGSTSHNALLDLAAVVFFVVAVMAMVMLRRANRRTT
jgi:hypothetical protein